MIAFQSTVRTDDVSTFVHEFTCLYRRVARALPVQWSASGLSPAPSQRTGAIAIPFVCLGGGIPNPVGSNPCRVGS